MIRYRLFVVIGFIGVLLVSCAIPFAQSRKPPETITVEMAKAVLDEAVALAERGDIDGLCGMGGSVLMCEGFFINREGEAAIPSNAPLITDSYIMPDGENSVGGRILVLEGEDGLGNPYRTEFLVFYPSPNSVEPVPLHPIYWSGISMLPGDGPHETQIWTPTPAP